MSAAHDLCHGPEPRIHGLVQALLLLLIRERADHGYQLVRRLHDEIPADMVPDRAVIYRMLRDLERGGSVTSALESGAGGPARKVYSLTEAGLNLLEVWRGTVSERIVLLSRFLDRYHAVTETQTHEETS